jgi:hypothetical protein
MFFLFDAIAPLAAASAARRACASSLIGSEAYPVSILSPACSSRLALGREDSS